MSLRVASFVSGSGTTMEHVFRKAKSGEIPGITPALVVASKPGIGAIEKAMELGVPFRVLQDPKSSAEILCTMYAHKIDVIFQNGYLPRMPEEVVGMYSTGWRQILNQHPGIVRSDHLDFWGKGMYGARVTAARILYLLAINAEGEKVFTESTVQRTHEELDKWVLLGMRRLSFGDVFQELKETKNFFPIGRTANIPFIQESIRDFTKKIQDLLLPMEHENVTEILGRLGKGEALKEVSTYRESIVENEKIGFLEWAKTQAWVLFPNG